MAIHVPGLRGRRHQAAAQKRSVVAPLSLTAMVDMFTVLAVFLLQNYAVTGEVLFIPKEVKLPMARSVKELKPAQVVIVGPEQIYYNEQRLATTAAVRASDALVFEPLRQVLAESLAEAEAAANQGAKGLKRAFEAKQTGEIATEIPAFRKITIQADKSIEFLTIKKMMATVYAAGAQEVNFAVIKKADSVAAN